MNYGIILIREKEVSLAVVTDHGELLDEQTLPAGDACDTMFDACLSSFRARARDDCFYLHLLHHSM